MAEAEGLEKIKTLKAAGFRDEEIDMWRSDTAQTLLSAGYNQREVGEYFGEKNPDMEPLKQVFAQNFAKAQAESAGVVTPATEGVPELKPQREAQTFEEAIQAGWQMSVTGLIKRGERPDIVLPEHAPMYYRIASQVSGLAGDLPAMWAGAEAGAAAGGAIGGAVGSVVPGAGTVAGAAAGAVVGGGAGAFALPAAIRTAMMQHYEKGDVTSAQDFWERASATFIESAKAGAVGAATAGVGGVVGKVATGVGAGVVTKTTAQLSAEVATMTTMGAAVEGHLPEPTDFVEAAILVGGMHGVMKAPAKLRTIYAESGIKPGEIAQQAMTNPLIKQELLAEGPTNVVPKVIAQENGIPINSEIRSATKGEAVTKEGAASPPLTEAEQKIASQIGEKPKEPGKSLPTARELYKDFVDKLDPVNEAIKKLNKDPESLKAEENPYLLTRSANDYSAKTKHVIEKGTLDFKTLAKNGESFEEIIKPFKKNPEPFDLYLAAKRAIEVEGQGKTSGFDVEAAKQVVKEGAEKFEPAAQRLYEFKNKNLEYLRDSGVVSKEEFKTMTEMNKAHVSFSRILETEKGAGESSPGARKLGALKEFKGSTAKIESPLMTTVMNTETIFKLAEKNRAVSSLIELAEKTEGQSILERVSAPKGKLRENEFELWRNGEREVWRASEQAPSGLAEAIKSLDGGIPEQNMAFKIANGFTAIKKFSITIVPDFIIKNLFRDQLTVGVFTKGGARPFLDILPAMKDLIAKNDNYYNWLKSGGAQGTFIEINKSYVEGKIFELDSKTNFIGSTWNVLKKPVDFMQAAGMLTEHATRLAEFKRTAQGASEGSKIFEGGYAARESTVDFSRVGAKLSALNSITAFQNMSIQGLDRTIRAIKENPAGITLKAAMYITAPSVMLWYANKDDERYKNLPRWQKDLFWIIPVDRWVVAKNGEADAAPDYLLRVNAKGETEINEGPIFRIPKPQELGVLFGTIPERTLEKYLGSDPNAMKDFDKTITSLVLPSVVPDAVVPIAEQWSNKSLFTGNKIVSGPAEKVLPAYQYNEYTTETAKQIGKMVRVLPYSEEGDLPISSPAVVENYVRSWSGNVGMYALQVADKALEVTGVNPDPMKPTDTLSDIPFIKSFVVRYPNTGAQPIQDFYDEYEKHEKVSNTIQHLAKTGDFTNLEKELNDPQVLDMLVKLKGTKEALSAQSQMARLIYKNPEFSPDDKRQMLDGIYYGMIETAKNGNEMMRIIDEVQKSEGSK